MTVAIDGGGKKAALAGNKLRLDLVPPQSVAAIAEVLGFGARKYEAHNWMRGLSWSQVVAGVKRHIASFEVGEETDAESGLPHLAHALCGLVFIHWYAHGPARDTYEAHGFDDRAFWSPCEGGGSDPRQIQLL